MYGLNSPAIPLVLAYATGLSIPLIVPVPPWIALSLLGFSLLLLLFVFFRGVPFPFRQLPALFLLSSWGMAGVNAMVQDRMGKRIGDARRADLHQSGQVKLKDHLGRIGKEYRFRGRLLRTDIPVLVRIKQEGKGEAPLPGDRLSFRKRPSPISPPKGPAAFDRKAYWADKGIHHELRLSPHGRELMRCPTYSLGPSIIALRWRERVFRWLRDRTPLQGDGLAVASALWLGRKTDLSASLREDYADAGGMHVLAVSGLHVGIVYLMLQGMLSPLRKIRIGRKALPIIFLLFLWGYALMTGWSASVVRAVLMFSLYSVGQGMERSPHIGNAIAGSALIVLLFDPSMIGDIGFLLSYSAVIAIVTLYPLIEPLWRPNWKPLSWLWKLLVVSFSAQFGVLPIVLAIFGEFPLWFEFTNPLLLPLTTLALYSGLLLGVFSWIPTFPFWIGYLAQWVIWAMNAWVDLISQWPGSGVRIGPLTIGGAVLLATSIATSILWLYRMLSEWAVGLLWASFLALLFLQDLKREQKMVLGQHAGRAPPVTAVRIGERVLLWSPSPLEGYRKQNLSEYWRSEGVGGIVQLTSEKASDRKAFACEGVRVLYWNVPVPKGFPIEKGWDLVILGEEASLPKSVFQGEKVERWISLRRSGSQSSEDLPYDIHDLARDGAYFTPL